MSKDEIQKDKISEEDFQRIIKVISSSNVNCHFAIIIDVDLYVLYQNNV